MLIADEGESEVALTYADRTALRARALHRFKVTGCFTLRITRQDRENVFQASNIVKLTEQPFRGELFSIDVLQRHARKLAQRHQVAARRGASRLLPRLASNERLLCDFNDHTLRIERTRRITPAAEWLLDNFHLIEEHIRTARRHLPRGFSRTLPHLASGPCANFPRVYEIALELITHVDGRIDAQHLMAFVGAYQEVMPLKLGELWAIPIMLRLSLIESLRRIAASLAAARKERDLADQWAARVLNVAEKEPSKLIVVVADLAQSGAPLTRAFVTEFWQRMQEKAPAFKLALSWIEDRLAEEGIQVEQLVHAESQNQAADQISVGNSISSLRFLDAMDWREFVETLSAVEQTLRCDPADVYSDMDFATRDAYRHRIEKLARRSGMAEWDVAARAIDLAERSDPGSPQFRHVGHYLVNDEGSARLKLAIGIRMSSASWPPALRRAVPMAGYLGGIALLSLLITLPFVLLAAAHRPPVWELIVITALTLLAASQLSISIANWLTTLFVKPRGLPRLDFSSGLPPDFQTMVVVPTILTNPHGIERLLEGLEVRYLANRDENVSFALLTDFADAPEEHMSEDESLVEQITHGIEALNEKYKSDRSGIFFLFHRPRLWNEKERAWMGYERKRGKLADLNRFLRGGQSAFSVIVGDTVRSQRVRYVITLDTDTQLPRDAARQLVGAMAHPLNQPVYDETIGRIVQGFGIMQPRVAVSLPSASRSRFAELFSGEPGIDPYTRAVSDVYQDLFNEGSFIGKGIYDVDAFHRAVGGKFPENRILSHDLLEGSYARCALASDVQLFEDFPSLYTADTRRRHRWMRGDWQIASWLLPRVPGPGGERVNNPIHLLSRWKIFDNLRRSVVPIGLMALLFFAWLNFPREAALWTGLALLVVFFPGILTVFTELVRRTPEAQWRMHLASVGRTARVQFGQALVTLACLPYDAWISLDAAVRSIVRLVFTRQHLLEWQTAGEAERRSGNDLLSHVLTMWIAPATSLLGVILLVLLPFNAWRVAAPFLVLWCFAPAVAWWISQPLERKRPQLAAEQVRSLRMLSRKTWRYFETFAAQAENWLPPDNFQEHPRPIIASRTSPTNIAIAMLSTLSAWDFGYISVRQLRERLGNTLDTLDKMDRYQGHFYNWYDTRTLQVLPPPYLSTVDNGNFSGLLLTLSAGLGELAQQPWPTSAALAGLTDTLNLLMERTRRQKDANVRQLMPAMDSLCAKLASPPPTLSGSVKLLDEALTFAEQLPGSPAGNGHDEFPWWRQAFEEQCREMRDEFHSSFPWLKPRARFDALKNSSQPLAREVCRIWDDLDSQHGTRQLQATLARVNELLPEIAEEPDIEKQAGMLLRDFRDALQSGLAEINERAAGLRTLATRCDQFAIVDFTLLYDRSRKLFSIGYNVANHRLDPTYYDLLASEARLASFVAIALGQLPQEHWFALGRSLTSVDGRQTLISWSGSMFEYLMPLLVMPNYEQTLLDDTCQSAVARQIAYGTQIGLPWGVSESGFNLTDAQSNYQYRAFGVPGLGFKRGLAEDRVVAPYATVMALMFAPQKACQNLERLRKEGADGRYGYYEAIDYTPARLPRGRRHAVVHSFMAHHQGMVMLSLAHCLLDRPMQRRFQTNPRFRAAELLLQERVPRETSILFPHELEANRARESASAVQAPLRVLTDPNEGPPEVHLLSNGRYHVAASNSGGGYSLWNEVALTRWREDPTRDCWGTFLYLRDKDTGRFWSAAYQPTLEADARYETVFSLGRAEYRVHCSEIDAYTEISVSSEDDVEVRRLSLTNQSRSDRIIEVTSFAEIVLNTMAADQAHPAFNKLFIQTEILPGSNAIIFSRRPRAHTEKPPWLFHLLLVQGSEIGAVSFETDRSQFLGRGRSAHAPAAMISPTLSNSEGSVLDPAAAIRRTLRLSSNQTARVTLVSGSAGSREALMNLIEKYQDQAIADRVFELAWAHGNVTLRHLNATEAQAQMFGRLAGALLYSRATRRANPTLIAQNRRSQRDLWAFGISGDLPIVVVRNTSQGGLGLVREMLQAHAYWRLKGLPVDLVILNDDDSGYRQAVHDQIMTLIASGIEAHMVDKPGGIFVRRAEQLSHDDQVLLQSVARIVLSDQNGPLSEQLQRRTRSEPVPPALVVTNTPRTVLSPQELPKRDLIYFNGFGGFTPDGREYITTLQPGRATPAPWVNILANPNFGTLVTESGGSYTWSENCHEFRLTPWHNDPVTDQSGEAVYIRDEKTGRFWSPTPLPARGETPYVTRHGFGYSVFEHTEDGIFSELWNYVAVDAPVKFVRLVLRNVSGLARHLSVTGFWEWVLGEHRQRNLLHVVTELESNLGAILARNAFNADFQDCIAFVTASGTTQSITASRTEFVGRNRTLANPAAMGRTRLSGRTGAGLDPCAAIRTLIELQPGEEREVIFKIGAARSREKAHYLMQIYRSVESCRDALNLVWTHWNKLLGSVQVETPDAAFNVLANGWLLYQALACRMWGRTGFYQSGGAFGFRDQLQDAMALVHSRPALLREHLLLAAAHQFREGDVQHWWHPPSERGVRTRISDDYLWLPYATCRYVECLGDTGVLDEKVPFLEGRLVRPDEESYYDVPGRSTDTATLYEHCVRAIRNGLKFGEHGLPLMGCGDWNDGMNLVGEHGKGESVWLGMFLFDVLKHFSQLARNRGDEVFAEFCTGQAEQLRGNIEKNAWDGEWYRRAWFDDGTPLGSHVNPECKIDSIPQSWSVISGLAQPERARAAMEAVGQRLVRHDARLIQLFDPPFDKSNLEPGYIKGYVPGVRENGGQYTHGALWSVMAFALLGKTATAWQLFNLINPVRHADSPEGAARYKVEPYVIAADVYGVGAHAGRGGWTWYTGSGGWLYRLLIETFLGITLEVDKLRFTPRAHSSWKSFKVHYRFRETPYLIELFSDSGKWTGEQKIVLDGQKQDQPFIPLNDDRRDHNGEVRMG